MITVNKSIFRAYDIRGIVDTQIDACIMQHIGKAIASYALENQQKTLAFGRDGRLSSPHLADALKQGILSTGCDIIDLGIVPSPLVYFAASTLPCHSGVMVTGSHNPANYNGVKMMIGGTALSSEQIQDLFERIQTQNYHKGLGRLSNYPILPEYIDAITAQIKLARPLKIVVDSGNGVAGVVAPSLYKALGCEVIELYSEVNGHFPHHHPDPSELENLTDLIDAVKKHQADIGLAFDGDADRLGVITNLGENIWPDRQLILYAIDILARHPHATIVYDVKCSYHLKTMIEKYHGQPVMWKTGHSLIKAKLKETGALLAGEMSGHTFFKDNWYGFDDAIYAGARLLSILAKETRTSSEIFQDIPDSYNTPELKLAIDDEVKFEFMDKLIASADFPNATITTIDGLRVDFPDRWALIRPSNTTPYLILRFEADTPIGLKHIQEDFREFLLSLEPRLSLPF
jgi:phosphomannomutase / phosphoglucomutase